MNLLLQSFAGGLAIGAAAAALLLATGGIAGISGILGAALRGDFGSGAWRLAFLAGLVAAPWLVRAAGPAIGAPTFAGGIGTALVAGVVVGYGAGRGDGCTSGHGVCGLANLSRRSLAATATFMTVAAATVFVARHVVGVAS